MSKKYYNVLIIPLLEDNIKFEAEIDVSYFDHDEQAWFSTGRANLKKINSTLVADITISKEIDFSRKYPDPVIDNNNLHSIALMDPTPHNRIKSLSQYENTLP